MGRSVFKSSSGVYPDGLLSHNLPLSQLTEHVFTKVRSPQFYSFPLSNLIFFFKLRFHIWTPVYSPTLPILLINYFPTLKRHDILLLTNSLNHPSEYCRLSWFVMVDLIIVKCISTFHLLTIIVF